MAHTSLSLIIFVATFSTILGECPYSKTNSLPPDNLRHQHHVTSHKVPPGKETQEQSKRSLQSIDCSTIESIQNEIKTFAETITDQGERGHFFGGILRLAAHDFMDFDAGSSPNLGSDGCLDFEHEINKGLSDTWCKDCFLTTLFSSYSSAMSRADFWVASANAVVAITSGFRVNIPFKYGRQDSLSTCPESSDRIPTGDEGCSEVEGLFLERMGLTWKDAVALMGGHTLGRANGADGSGHEGTWEASDCESTVFNKKYYSELRKREWRPRTLADGRVDWTWGRDRDALMLNADMCLFYDIPEGNVQNCCVRRKRGRGCEDGLEQCALADGVRPMAYRAVRDFSKRSDNEFYDAYVEAWTKATELGHSGLTELSNCPVPEATERVSCGREIGRAHV